MIGIVLTSCDQLVLRSGNSSTTIDLLQNGLDRSCPDEGFGVGVVGLDVAMDGDHQVADPGEGAATDGTVGELTEPDFDEVQPGGAGGHEVKVEARPAGEPAFHLGMAMGAVVVEDQVQVEVLRVLTIEPAQKAPELLVPVV